MFGLIPTEEADKLKAIRKLQCDRKYKKKLAKSNTSTVNTNE